MLESRWLRWVGPGAIAVLVIGSVAATTVGAGPRPWQQRPCPTETGTPTMAARSALPDDPAALHGEAWFRLDPRLDRRGALEGQRLAVGLDGDRASQVLDLPPESFAAGPFGAIVLVGSDDGVMSRLEAVHVAAACSWALGEESSVIRRATVDPAGASVYEARVDRTTRADLGIWARPLDGSRPPIRVLDPIEPDERFGRTFATDFTWDVAGGSLAVASCGEAACRTRVLDLATGAVRAVATPDLGAPIGLAGDALVTYAACPGLPCPILTTDLATGARSTLADAALSAVTVTTAGGPRVVHEVAGESGIELRSVAIDDAAVDGLGSLTGDLRLQPAAAVAEAATRTPPGWVVIGPDGRLPQTGPGPETQLRHVPDGATVQLEEVAR